MLLLGLSCLGSISFCRADPILPNLIGNHMVLQQGREIRIVLKDVMIGEVWLASGQSNMAFALSGAAGAAEEIPKADYPQIRLFTVPKKIALSSQDDTLPATWQICSPDTAKGFSAVAYFFVRELHQSLNIPIGVRVVCRISASCYAIRTEMVD